MSLTLKISELFISLQGEGARAGEVSGFIRLQGCSAKHACYASGVECDTEFESGKEMSLESIDTWFKSRNNKLGWLIFTGGEPLDQLSSDILLVFRSLGYHIAIETSGIKAMTQEIADLIDHIVVSPKVAEHVLEKHFGHIKLLDEWRNDGSYANVHELRYCRHSGQPGIPQPSLKAKYQYLSPHTEGAALNADNLRHCIRLCQENPEWRLSIQMHKVWGIL